MKTSESIDKIAPALIKAHAEMDNIHKSGENQHDRYNYAKLEDYYKVAKPILQKHGMSMIESAPSITTHEGRVTSTGKPQNAIIVSTSLRIIHMSGQWIEIDSQGEGQDRADKSTYKAITGSRKYAIAMAGNLVTTDDPEGDETVENDDRSSKPPKASETTQTNFDSVEAFL